jgi:hypothetical protein
MMKKITWALFAAVLATSFASPVLAQEYTLSPGDAAAISASQEGRPGLWDYAPVPHSGHVAVQKRGVKLYDEVPDVQSQTRACRHLEDSQII